MAPSPKENDEEQHHQRGYAEDLAVQVHVDTEHAGLDIALTDHVIRIDKFCRPFRGGDAHRRLSGFFLCCQLRLLFH